MAIFAIVLLNALRGYIQQSRAEQAVAALRQISAAHASVIRDGARQSIPATELVPGDIIPLKGDTVPADARLIQSTALQTAEAALTGESLPVSKDPLGSPKRRVSATVTTRSSAVHAATCGRRCAVVMATGMQTQMGRIAGMLKQAPYEITPLQKELGRVGKLLGKVVLVIAIVTIATTIVKIAAVIATELGTAANGRAVTGAELERMPEDMLDRTLRGVSVYARVNREHKLQIVRALQPERMTVAMTGDGVNDAPALKTADVGVALGITGTDVSREAADIVLADDNFASIVAAVEKGRTIFSNIRKFLRYLLSSNIGEVMTMFFGVLLVH